jgi:salicylate biosynthesis isochorismate synthase
MHLTARQIKSHLKRMGSTNVTAVGLVRRVNVGALLSLDESQLVFSWCHTGLSIHAVGYGTASREFGSIEWFDSSEAPPVMPWFGGWSFDQNRTWDGFDTEQWMLPELLLWWENGQTFAAAFGPPGTLSAQLERRLDVLEPVEKSPVLEQVWGEVSEDRVGFLTLVERALGEIERGTFTKLVLARTLKFELSQPLALKRALKALEVRFPECFVYFMRGHHESYFMGASPETLCRGSASSLQVDALAGTGFRTVPVRTPKNFHEHQEVVTSLEESLRPFAQHLVMPKAPLTKRVGAIDHLHTPMTMQLKPGVDPIQVARKIHPTPAVAGTPQREAVQWLSENEKFSRGWYAGAIGMRGAVDLCLCVAIRSAHVTPKTVTIFAGCGIVAGSVAAEELTETDRKAESILSALRGDA